MPVLNFTTYTDADYYQQFQVTAGGSPMSLVGASLKMGIRKKLTDITEVLLLETISGGGISIVDAPTGMFTIYISKEQLQRIVPGTYVHSLIMTLDGYRTGIGRGEMTHNEGPSR